MKFEKTLRTISLQSTSDGCSYKYLGQDENIGYVAPLNKARVTAEYKKRVRKLWPRERSPYNKHSAYNVFALPALTLLESFVEQSRKLRI